MYTRNGIFSLCNCYLLYGVVGYTDCGEWANICTIWWIINKEGLTESPFVQHIKLVFLVYYGKGYIQCFHEFCVQFTQFFLFSLFIITLSHPFLSSLLLCLYPLLSGLFGTWLINIHNVFFLRRFLLKFEVFFLFLFLYGSFCLFTNHRLRVW